MYRSNPIFGRSSERISRGRSAAGAIERPIGGAEVQETERLSVLEQTVVALASLDDLRSIEAPARLGRLVFRLLGGRAANQLADPRLEALRRFTVLRKTKTVVSEDEVRRFLDVGFSERSVSEVDALLASAKR